MKTAESLIGLIEESFFGSFKLFVGGLTCIIALGIITLIFWLCIRKKSKKKKENKK